MTTEETTHFPCFNKCAIIFDPVICTNQTTYVCVWCRVYVVQHHSDVAIMTERESEHCCLSETVRKAPGVSSHMCCLYNVNVGTEAVTLLAIWSTAVIFEKSQKFCLFLILPRYAYNIHPLHNRRQTINRINDGLMLFKAWSTRFMSLNNNTLIFTKENAFENVVYTIWVFRYRYQCARTIAPWSLGLMCHQLFYNNPALV